MDTIWTALGLEPTKDVSAIKRAYAEKAKTCHPEEDPEGFLQLRQAYQAALAWAENGETPPAAGCSAKGFGPSSQSAGFSLSDQPSSSGSVLSGLNASGPAAGGVSPFSAQASAA